MDNRTYPPAQESTRFYLATVELVSKAKRCGKENCNECPHEGYWYAVIQAPHAAAGRRTEIYVGREWTNTELTAKLTPALAASSRPQFAAAIAAILTEERAAELRDQLADIAATIKAIETERAADIANLERAHAAELKETNATAKRRTEQLTTNQRRLQTELAQLKKGKATA